MKKAALAVVLAAPLAVYPVATWMLGKQVETTLAAQYQLLESSPYLQMVKRDYQRGVYRSTDTATFEVIGAGDEGRPMRFTLRSSIAHGPLPGWSVVGLAMSDSELVLDDDTRHALGRLMGDKQPLAVHTLYRFDGSGQSNIESPSFIATIPGAEGEGDTHVDWKGLSMQVDFGPHARGYVMHGEAPGLEVRDAHAHVVMRGMHMTADQTRPFDDEPLFYTGAARFQIDEITASEAGGQGELARIGKVAIEQDVKTSGEFIDFVTRIGAETLKVGADNYGPVHYDVSLNHLHARSVARLYREAAAMYAQAAAGRDAQDVNQRALKAMIEPATELLRNNPEFSLDRISFMSPQGEARVAARLRLDDARQEDFDNPVMLLGKLDARAEVDLPEAMLMLAALAGEQAADEDATERLTPEDVVALLEALGEEGYLKRANGVVRLNARFANGQLTLNGKPFDPSMLTGEDAADD